MDCDWGEREYYEYASVWRRLLAGVIDWLVVLTWSAGLGTLAAIGFAFAECIVLCIVFWIEFQAGIDLLGFSDYVCDSDLEAGVSSVQDFIDGPNAGSSAFRDCG